MRKRVKVTQSTVIKTIRFLPNVEQYDFTQRNTLKITGTGIVNNGATTPGFAFHNHLEFSGRSSIRGSGPGPQFDNRTTIYFKHHSYAGKAEFFNIGTSIQFQQKTSAGKAQIANLNPRSLVEFIDQSTGSRARIFNSAGLVFFNSEGPGKAGATIGSIVNKDNLAVYPAFPG